jgi:hypothetical protein
MFRKIILLTTMMMLLLVLSVASVGAASPPSDVNFEVETSLLGAPSPFQASGPAVDDGLICEEGTVVDASSKEIGFSQNGFNFQGIKQFTCDDGTGEFLVNLQARNDFRMGITFNWNVISGTGDYEDLHGAGSGIGLDTCGLDCVLDIYEGGLHID